MKKSLILCVCFALLVSMSLCGCGSSSDHQHSWVEADCSHPVTCKTCGEVKGNALGHEWSAADCTRSETCLRCGMQGMEALGHDWQEQGCTKPDRCLRCGAKSETIREHEFIPATYYAPKTCAVCGAQEGEAIESSFAARGMSYRTVDLSSAAGRSFDYLTGTKSGTSANTTTGTASAKWIYALDKDAKEDSEARTATFRLPDGSMAAAEKYDMSYLPDEEGYEWLGVKLTARFSDIKYKSRGVKPAYDFTDYYTGDYVFSDYEPELEDGKKKDDAISMQSFSVNYLGQTYENCLLVRSLKQTDTDELGTVTITLFCRIPVGYDGCTVMLYNSQNTNQESDSKDAEDEAEKPTVLDQADGDTLFFRFR